MMKNLLLAAALLSSTGIGAFAQNLFLVQSPSNLAGSYTYTDSFTADGWGANLDTTAVTADAAFALDGTVADSIVCEAVVNSSEVAGKVAFLYRGSCNFSLKAYQAQAAGAVGCVIINNEPGNLINMLGGDSASAIHIPVIFISDADGAALTSEILAGNVEVFIGNPNGVFQYNIGAYRAHIGMASSQSIPTPLVQSGTTFEVPLGAWIFNFGSENATNAMLQAVIDRDGTEIYNETSSGETIAPEDSLFFSLPTFSENGYEAGFYTITYTMFADDTDELPVDNVLTVSFWINDEGIYSKGRVDPVDGPQGVNGLRPAEGTEFQWCIVMMEQQFASEMQVTGMTFSTLTNDIDLTGQAVQLAVYEWNDPITTSVSFTDLNEITDNEFYDYAADLQGEFVSHEFAAPLELLDDQKYLACATIFIDDMFLGVDGNLDYNVTYDSYPNEVFFPLNDIDGGTWYAAGFGADNVPALVLNMELANGIADDINAMEVTPFPNPTVDMINIPFGTALDGNVTLDIHSVDGKLVRSEALQLQNTNQLRVDVSGLSSGLHTFSLTFEDNSRTSFRVVIAK